jgi:glycosyltransferase involved in cell wall biosynthesis
VNFPRVRFLITSLDRGGAEKYLSMVARGLARRGGDVGVACLKGFGPVAEELRAAGVPCVSMRANPGRLAAWLRAERPAILYGFLFHATIAARMAGRLAGVPRIVSSEQLMEMEQGARLWAYRATWDLCDHYVAVADAVRAFLRRRVGVPDRRITVIPGGLDPAAYRVAEPASDSTPLVVSIGHLRRNDQKGYRVLVEAARALQGVRFAVAGEGPLRAELERRAGGRVAFVGPVQDVDRFLGPASLYVQPSRWEGFPNAVIEAMACGKAVVATRVAGIPEQVVEGQTGLLVRPGDAAGLTAAIRAALADRRRLAAMGRAGRARVEREFTEQRLLERHARLFERLVERLKD